MEARPIRTGRELLSHHRLDRLFQFLQPSDVGVNLTHFVAHYLSNQIPQTDKLVNAHRAQAGHAVTTSLACRTAPHRPPGSLSHRPAPWPSIC